MRISDWSSDVCSSDLNEDKVRSFQDFARYNSAPAFIDTSGLIEFDESPNAYRNLSPGGVFCDPQIGCSNGVAIFDISTSKSKQFSQEFRLQSSFDGPFNFSLGTNYTRFKTLIDYYVMSNVFTALAYSFPIGRASCRERVCYLVLIQVFAI